MRKSLLEIYALAVCFFTVACFVIVAGMAVWNVVGLTAPAFTMDNHEWSRHQSDEAFAHSPESPHPRAGPDAQPPEPLTGDALTEARTRSYARALRAERRGAFQDLVRQLIILGIDLLVFGLHWRIAARARQQAAANPG